MDEFEQTPLEYIDPEITLDEIPDPKWDWAFIDREIQLAYAAVAEEAKKRAAEEEKDYIYPIMEALQPILVRILAGAKPFGVEVDTVAAAQGVDLVQEVADDVEDLIQRVDWKKLGG